MVCGERRAWCCSTGLGQMWIRNLSCEEREICSGVSECTWTWPVWSEHWALARLALGEQLDGFTEWHLGNKKLSVSCLILSVWSLYCRCNLSRQRAVFANHSGKHIGNFVQWRKVLLMFALSCAVLGLFVSYLSIFSSSISPFPSNQQRIWGIQE